MKKRIFTFFSALVLCAGLFTGCSGAKKEISSVEELNSPGMKVGIVQGTAAMRAAEEYFTDAQIFYYPIISDGFTALSSGQLDAFVHTEHVIKKYAESNPDITILDEPIAYAEVAVGIKKGNSELEARINEFIAEAEADGTLADMKCRWVDCGAQRMPELDKPENPVGTLKIATEGLVPCFTFFGADGEVMGLDIELGTRLAYYLNMDISIETMSFDALIPTLDSGKADVILNELNKTPERAESIDFSQPYYTTPIKAAIKSNGTAASEKTGGGENVADNINGSKIGALTGSKAIAGIEKYYPEAVVLEFDNFSSAVEAVKANKIDYVITSRAIGTNFVKNNIGKLRIVEEKYLNQADTSAAAAVRKGYERLDEINEIITRYLNDGTMDKIIANWVSDTAANDTSIIPRNTDTPVWKVGVAANREPMCFVRGENEICGLDAELAERIAYDMGMHVEFVDMNFAALLPSLESGKVDFAISNMGATEERRQIVDFSVPYFENPYVFLAASTATVEETVSESFIDSIKASFTRTFITENRWKLVLNGLGITILISLCAFVIGSLWGGVICALMRSKRKIANIPAKVYVRLLQGTPIVVLLMILYYIVFKSVDISAIIVAIIGFALNLGAYTSQIFKTAIDSVDKGQIEAASAMGFNKFQVLIKIIFPQAARNALPVYKGEFISLVKSTSIVGYIAIQDLTKVSDIIRSRTYEAFFPLIATAIIYFVVTYIFIVLLNVLEKKIDPKRRKRVVRGVEVK